MILFMQSLLLEVINLIVIEAAIATVIMISLAFYRLSVDTKFRMWSLGWNLYITTASLFALHSMETCQLIDLILIPLASLGVAMIAFELDESISKELKRHYYSISFLAVLLWVSICFVLSFPALAMYIPLSFEMPIACYMSAKQLAKIRIEPRISIYTLTLGLLIVAATSVVPPFAYFFDILLDLILFHATGILMIGISMYALLFRYMSLKIKEQYNISRLLTRVVQHDIRNYIQIISNTIQLARDNPQQREYWLRIANDTVEKSRQFIDDIREIELIVSSLRFPLDMIDLKDLTDNVLKRVAQEYELGDDAIRIQEIEHVKVLTSVLAQEIIWNIIDNAFKHGSKDIEIVVQRVNSSVCVLQIQDSAGGMKESQLEYINSSKSGDMGPPSSGLGLGLIKGLAPLCGIELRARNMKNSQSVPGTAFILKFRRVSSE